MKEISLKVTSRDKDDTTSQNWTSITKENSDLELWKGGAPKYGQMESGTRATSRMAKKMEKVLLSGPTASNTLDLGRTTSSMG